MTSSVKFAGVHSDIDSEAARLLRDYLQGNIETCVWLAGLICYWLKEGGKAKKYGATHIKGNKKLAATTHHP
jgi:hypothetical protein